MLGNNMKDTDNRIQVFMENSNKACAALVIIQGIQIDAGDVQLALMELFGIKDESELPEKNLSASQIIELLFDYDFRRSDPEILAQVTLEKSIVPDGMVYLLTEKTVRHGGEIWRIHKCDADPFPSNPHAHNVETGLKLDLATGGLYLKKQLVKTITMKELQDIRKKATELGVDSLPPLRE